jgi:hypothetical protein
LLAAVIVLGQTEKKQAEFPFHDCEWTRSLANQLASFRPMQQADRFSAGSMKCHILGMSLALELS